MSKTFDGIVVAMISMAILSIMLLTVTSPLWIDLSPSQIDIDYHECREWAIETVIADDIEELDVEMWIHKLTEECMRERMGF